MKRWILGFVALAALSTWGAATASAQGFGHGHHGHGGYHNGHHGAVHGGHFSGHHRHHGHYGRGGYGHGLSVYSGYGGIGLHVGRRPRWHDTSHYDYHPGYYVRHRGHYDYVPGYYDFHPSGHYHW